MLAKPAFEPGNDNEMFYSSLDALDSYFGSMTDINFGGGDYLGADWDEYLDAVALGYPGTVREYYIKGKLTKYFIFDVGKTLVQVTIDPNAFAKNEWQKSELNMYVFGNDYTEYNFIQTYFDNYNEKSDLKWKLDRGWDYAQGFYNNKTDTKIYSDPRYSRMANGFMRDTPSFRNFSAENSICGKKNGFWEEVGSISWGYVTIKGESHPYLGESDNTNSSHRQNVSFTLIYHNILNQYNYYGR